MHNVTSFLNQIQPQAMLFRESLNKTLQSVQAINPNGFYIWRLLPHCGDVDLKVLSTASRNYQRYIRGSYNSGVLWSNVTEVAPWVSVFNDEVKLLVNRSNRSNHVILNYDDLSVMALNYYVKQGKKELFAHFDGQHYCAGGFPRLANALVMDAISHYRPNN